MKLRDFTGVLHKFDQITNCSISSCVKGRPRRFDKRIASRKRYTLPSEGSVSLESGISSRFSFFYCNHFKPPLKASAFVIVLEMSLY